MHSFDFLACVLSFSFLYLHTSFYFLTLYLTVHKQHLPCPPPRLSVFLSGEGAWQQQQVRYKITGEAGAIIPPADAGVFMRRVTVNDSVVVSPEARAQLRETCCFCQPSFLLCCCKLVVFFPVFLIWSFSCASPLLRVFSWKCHAFVFPLHMPWFWLFSGHRY